MWSSAAETERLMNSLRSLFEEVYPAAWTFPNPAGEISANWLIKGHGIDALSIAMAHRE
jgi:hypothetical protein